MNLAGRPKSMKHLGYGFLVAWMAFSASAQNYTFDIRQTHADGIYRAGEPVTFSVSLLENGEAAAGKGVRCIVYHDGREVKREDFPGQNKAQCVTSLEKPGWCQLTVVGLNPDKEPAQQMVEGKMKEILGYSGALVEPLKIQQGAPEPEDFDVFWAREKEKLRKIPMEAKTKPVPDAPDYLKISYVSVPVGSGFRPVEGVLKMPSGAKPKSLPVFLHVHGAGVHNPAAPAWQPPLPEGSVVEEPVIFMNLNAHGIPNDQPKEYYEGLRSGELKGYPYLNSDNPEKSYLKGMVLRLARALEYLKSLPEWNGRDIIVSGGSQGGAQALIAAGIDPQVTLIYADVPAMCDHGGTLSGRSTGWPKLYKKDADGTIRIAPDDRAEQGGQSIVKTAGYFDAANFARRIQCPAVLRTGGWDGTCPPTSVFAAYNNMPSPNKRIFFFPQGGHTQGIYKETDQQKPARFVGMKQEDS